MENYWQRPKTTRRYINPPFSERIGVLWCEGKITLGDIRFAEGPRAIDYNKYEEFGVWMLHGDSLEPFDFKKVHNTVTDDGTPIHTVEYTEDGIVYSLTCFCDTERKSTCFAKLTVTNTNEVNSSAKIGFIVRADLGEKLIVDAPDIYHSYAVDIDAWREINCDFDVSDGLVRTHNGYVTYDKNLTFDEKSGILYSDMALSSGEKREFVISIGLDNVKPFDYETELENTKAFWKKELDKINKLPEKLASDKEVFKMIRHLTALMLQNISYPVGMDFAIMRQGGLQRRLWPGEAYHALEALGSIGDFGKYIEPVIDAYFNIMQTESGEFKPLGIEWAMVTGNILYSFSEYALVAGKEYYEKYRDRAMAGFNWICRTRAMSKDSETQVAGLFPPKRSCDSALVFQAWCLTDTTNILSIERFLKAAKKFEDPETQRIESELNDYRKALYKCFEKTLAKSNGGPIQIKSFIEGMPGDQTAFSFPPSSSRLIEALKLDKETTLRIIDFERNEGMVHDGIYWRMPRHFKRDLDADGEMRIWYLTSQEEFLLYAFLRLGEKDMAKEIIEGIFKYAMTDEYLMIERYHCRDPYYAPWMPNVSANGRTILMMLKLSEYKSDKK